MGVHLTAAKTGLDVEFDDKIRIDYHVHYNALLQRTGSVEGVFRT